MQRKLTIRELKIVKDGYERNIKELKRLLNNLNELIEDDKRYQAGYKNWRNKNIIVLGLD